MHKTNLKLLFSLSFTHFMRPAALSAFICICGTLFFYHENNENFPFFLANCIYSSYALDAALSLPVLENFPSFFPRELGKLSGRSSCTMLYLINIIFCSLRLPFLLFHRTHHSTSARVFALCQVRFFSYLQLSDLHFFSVLLFCFCGKLKRRKTQSFSFSLYATL